jgi:CheY-like chemotaxis protein
VEQTGRDRGRALVIDDNPAVRQLVCEFLRILGFEAHAASSGREGLASRERESFSLVVTDLAMPEMSGWEVIEAIRRSEPELPVVLMSGSTSSLDAQRAFESGITILSKPFRLEDLQAAVMTATEGKGAGAAPGPPAAARSEDSRKDLLDRAQTATRNLREAGTWLATICEAMQAVLDERQGWRDQMMQMREEYRALHSAQDALAGAQESMARAVGSLRAERDGTLRLLLEIRSALDTHLQRMAR